MVVRVCESERENREKRESCNDSSLAAIAADVIFFHVSLYKIKWTSPVDVGGFAEPRKILCQCALPSDEQLSVHPRSAHGGAGNSPTNSTENFLATYSLPFSH